MCDEMPQRLLTDFELMILLATMRLGDEAYGVPIAHEIETATGRDVSRASVYTAIERLQRTGLVTSSLGEPTAERGGRAKRFVTVTTRGVRAVKDAQRALTTLWSGIPRLEKHLA